MTEYYNNRLCVYVDFLIENKYLSKRQYKYLSITKKTIRVARRACRNTPALVEFDSLPTYIQVAYKKAEGDPREKAALTVLEKFIVDIPEALEYFSSFRTNTGDLLKKEIIQEYYTNAIVLNGLVQLRNNNKALVKACNNTLKNVWSRLTDCVVKLDTKKYPHTLPTNQRRLKEKVEIYLKYGYDCLVHKGYGNTNSRKVTELLEKLILSIYCMENKPYSSWVHEYYFLFVAGKLNVVDISTGELFDRNDFYLSDKGMYVTISDTICWNYINNPKNRIIVDNVRSGNHRYNSTIRPHMHRSAPMFALSKISLDDRDLPRKMKDGSRVKAYYAYDVASGIVLGASYSKSKDANLFIDCIRDMFRNIESMGLGMPMEVEVEHHIANLFKDDLMKAGVLFPFVRWCAPGNSQEKHAEQLNKIKKYGFEKRYQSGIGRFYASLEANVSGEERVFNEELQKYEMVDKRYSYEELVEDDKRIIELYNNSIHRKYKSITCMQYFTQNINPKLAQINKPLLVRYIGEHTTTTIRRNMYCQVQYNKYMLTNPQLLTKLQPNNYTVDAYYLPNKSIEQVYIYQNENFIDECTRIIEFNTSAAEQTDIDKTAMKIQSEYIAKTDKMVRTGVEQLSRVKFLDNLESFENVESQIYETTVVEQENDYEYHYSQEDALSQL